MKNLMIRQEKREQVDLVILQGVLNADTSSDLELILDRLSQQAKPLLVMEMSQLTYISSAGIGCFIGVIKRIRQKEGDIRFAQVDSKVKRVFQLLDMTEFFQFFENLEEALQSYSV